MPAPPRGHMEISIERSKSNSERHLKEGNGEGRLDIVEVRRKQSSEKGKDEITTRWGSTLWSDVVKNVQNVGKCSLIFNFLQAWDVSSRRLPVRSKHWTWWWNPIQAPSCGVEKQKSQKFPNIAGWETPRIQQGGAAERYQKSQESATSRISTDSLLLNTRKKWNVTVRNYTLLVVKRHNQGAPKGKRNTIHGAGKHLQREVVLHLVSSAISKQNVNTHFGQARFSAFSPTKNDLMNSQGDFLSLMRGDASCGHISKAGGRGRMPLQVIKSLKLLTDPFIWKWYIDTLPQNSKVYVVGIYSPRYLQLP